MNTIHFESCLAEMADPQTALLSQAAVQREKHFARVSDIASEVGVAKSAVTAALQKYVKDIRRDVHES